MIQSRQRHLESLLVAQGESSRGTVLQIVRFCFSPSRDLGGSWVGRSGPLGPPASGEGAEPAPLCPCPQGQFSLTSGGGGAFSSKCRGQLSWYSIPGPAKSRADSAWPSDFILHVSYSPLRWHRPQTSTQIPVAAKLQTQTASWLWVEALITQVRMVLVAAWPTDTTKASGCGPNPGLLCDLWWRYGTQTSTQTPTVVKPWAPDMVLSNIWVWVSPLPQVAMQASQFGPGPSSSGGPLL